MPLVEMTAAAWGYPDGITRIDYEPGTHDIPEPLASCFVRMDVAEYVDEPVSAPQEPASQPATPDPANGEGQDESGAESASEPELVPPTAPEPPAPKPGRARK